MNETKEVWEEVYKSDQLPWLENPIPNAILEDFIKHFKKRDKILDYGGGDGLLSKILLEHELDVTCSDISENALEIARNKIQGLKTIQASHPSYFTQTGVIFDGILCWGVMHHVLKDEWGQYLKDFHVILKEGGLLLLGGHSTKDADFANGYRVSPTTGSISYAVNDIGDMAEEVGFKIESSDFLEFKEGFSGHKRVFNYFFLRKQK